MSNTLIYTTLFGKMRTAYAPLESDRHNADCICFSDRDARSIDSREWTVKTIYPWSDPLSIVKVLKCMPNMLGDYERSIYIDATVRPRLPLLPMFDVMQDCDLLCFRHNRRATVNEEYRHCLAIGKDSRERLDGMARTLNGSTHELFLGGILWRKHTPAIERFGREWLFHIFTGTKRDQISMPLAMEKSGVNFKALNRSTLHKMVMIHNKR